MPTYQYICANPDSPHEFERVQSFSDAAVSECPICGAAVRKRYGSVGVVFKGSGFYRNDSRGGTSSSDAPKADAKSETKSDSKSSSSTDSGVSAASSSSSGSSGKSESTSSSSAATKSDSPAASKSSSTSGSTSSS